MSDASPDNVVPDTSALGDVTKLEDVVDRNSLGRVCRSFLDLFGVSVRVISQQGMLVADAHVERPVCRYVNTLHHGHVACSQTVADAKNLDPEGETALHPCFTGAVYRVAPIIYQERRVGRIVIGPYLPAETREVPPSLLNVDPEIDPETARHRLAEMPRVRTDTAERLAEHMRGIVDVLLFSSHRAQLMSEMHVASVRESYRELAEKNVRLEQAYDRLKELDRLKSNFLATVSHELRTPLTSIIGYSEMLDSELAGELNEEQRDFVHTIQSKGEHLLSLISSLLDMSKLEQGTLTLNKEELDPSALVDEVAKTVTPQAHKKDVKIETHVESGVPRVHGDPVRIKQALFNLADNAVKFSPEQGRVKLSAHATEMEHDPEGEDGLGAALMSPVRRAVAFSVGDTGIGIPREELSKVFDAFYQVNGGTTREHGGTGLGLSVVQRLAEAHDGTVHVDSEPGEGTTFTLVIPEPEDGPG